jgi:hypothetical protein
MSLILNGTDGLSDVDGSAATPAIRGTDANTGIFFPAADTIAFSEGGAESMRIDSSGNVGIGTSTPSSYYATQLVVAGGDEDGITILNTNAGSANRSILAFANGTGASGYNGFIGYNHASNFMGFYTNGGNERMRIDSSGNLLVNGTTQYAKLTVASDTANGYNYASNSIANQPDHMLFLNGGTTVGSIQRFGGSAVVYNTTSDYRLKENIVPMVGALNKVTQLKPCTYTWKLDGENGQGFIAHELAEVVPDCVSGEKDATETYTDEDGNEKTRIKPQQIDTSYLIATLTAAIQELNEKVEAQAVRIAELEGAK